jgi:hypothetical protein
VAGTESDNWRIGQAMAEYKARCGGGRGVLFNATAAQGGAIEYCGTESDKEHWTAAYVRADDEALLPLAVGSFTRIVEQVTRIDRAATPIWDPRVMPPPVVILSGVRHHFRPAHGRYLIGVVEAGQRTVLLAAVGEGLAVVHVAGQERMILFRGGPFSFRELDVDGLLRTRPDVRPGAAEPARAAPVLRPSSSIRAHHARIAGKLRVDLGEGPAMSAVLAFGFEDLARRALSVTLGPKKKRKGKTRVSSVVQAIFSAVRVGCGDFEGLAGEILEQLKVFCPELGICAEVFADVLRLLRATGTCLLEHVTRRIWRLRLVGLTNPRAPLHRRFCKETVGLCRLDEALPASTSAAPSVPRTQASRPTAPQAEPPRATEPPQAADVDPAADPETNSAPTSSPADDVDPAVEQAEEVDTAQATVPAPPEVEPVQTTDPEPAQADLLTDPQTDPAQAADPMQADPAQADPAQAADSAQATDPAQTESAQTAPPAQADPAQTADAAPLATIATLAPEHGLPKLSAPEAAVLMMLLGMKEALKAAALDRAILQVERDELLTRLAVAEAQQARLTAEIRQLRTPSPKQNTASPAPRPATPAPLPARRRSLPLFVTESRVASPVLQRPGMRGSLAGLPLGRDAPPRAEPADGLPVMPDAPDFIVSSNQSSTRAILRALGPRGPPSAAG